MQKTKQVKVIEAASGFDINGARIKKLKVCAYCRVSSEHHDQKLSFEAQTEHFESFITKNQEWEYAGIYADYGISGKSKKNRAEFLIMIEDAKKHKIDLIVTKSISRFARNTADCIETVRQLKKLGVGVFFEKENINTLAAESELILTILSSIAEEELMSLSQNIRWSNQKRIKQGKVQVVTERFMGYDKDENGKLIINEEQAKVVKHIFELYISGLGVGPIAKRLMDEGIQTISGSLYWNHSVILSMLRNEKYCGDAMLQKTVTADTISFKRKKNRGEAPMAYIRDNHPAIINRETFDLVQELRNERRRSKGYNPDMAWKYQQRYPFSSIIYCGTCGAKFMHRIFNSTGNKTPNWACSTYIDERKANCEMKPIKDETVRRLFVKMFNKLYTNKKILRTYLNTLQLMGEAWSSDIKVKEIDSQIEQLLKEERALFAVSEKGYLGNDMFIVSHNELISKIELLREERNKTLEKLDGQDFRLGVTQEYLKMLENRSKPMYEFETEMFEKMVCKIIVKHRESLVFYLRNGMELTENYTWKRGTDII